MTSNTLQQSDLVIYEKMFETVFYMNLESGGEDKICFRTPSKYSASYRYIFDHNYPNIKRRTISGKVTSRDLSECAVYIIKHSNKTTEDIIEDYKKDDKIIKLQQPQKFGVITVWKVLGINNTKTR